MKASKLSAMFLLFALGVTVAGNAVAQVEAEVALARTQLQADRQAVVAANLPLTEVESAAFWPVYRTYRTEMAALGDQALKLVGDYAKAYGDKSITDEKGLMMTKDYLKLQTSIIELRQKYISKFNKVLPGTSVMRLYQIENKLDAAVAVSVADVVPLVEVK